MASTGLVWETGNQGFNENGKHCDEINQRKSKSIQKIDAVRGGATDSG
jgi:hypothetical protein